MGGLIQVSHSDWCAWTGGKPKADWSGLDTRAVQYPNDDFQYRPTSPGSSQKSTSHHERGMDIKFKRDDHLLDFLDIVDSYLRRTGMDSISYLVDPTNPTITVSVVQQFSKFELQEGISTSRDLCKTKYDRYDRNNDDSARNWQLNSIDEGLKKDIVDRLHPDDGFVSHWLQLIHLVQSTSFNRFEGIEREIENNLTVFKFPGQSIKDFASAFLT
jgi:hypothetical protein